ncbi:MAG TPA: type II secretion system protein GspI [Candidatus Binatia bacterium]|jgi:general secretion pathway protein I
MTGRAVPSRSNRGGAGFTLLEVLVAVAVLGLGLVSLLGLHVRNLDLIARDQRITESTLLARALMTDAEVEPFPEIGLTSGDFEDRYPGQFPDLRWEREVSPTPFPDVHEVRVRVFHGEEESGDDVTLSYYLRRRT